MNNTQIGKNITYLLRHNPEELEMDKEGYVNVADLLDKLSLTQDKLDHIVETNNKKRLAYNSDKSKIRASQGHSIKGIDVGLNKANPPHTLYHGTSKDSYEKIKKSGLSKMKRLHVHLTSDIKVAHSVGKRYSKKDEPIILKIDAKLMDFDGFDFFLSENLVWLTDNVPTKYISK